MANPLIPLQALATQPRQSYPQYQAQQFTLQNLQREGQAGDLQLREAQRKEQDQLKIKQVLGAGLPDDQTIQQLRMSGLPDAAFAYEKSVAERNKTIAESDEAQRKQHQSDIEQTASFANSLKQLPEGDPRRASAWYKYRSSHPSAKDMPDALDNMDIDMIVAESQKALNQLDRARLEKTKADEVRAQAEEQRKIADEQRKIEDAGKPSPLGAAFVSDGQQTQPYIQKNPDTGKWEIKSQQFGQAEAKPTATAPTTIRTAKGIMAFNPATQDFDKKVGDIPPAAGQVQQNIPGDWTKTGDDFLKTIPAQWRTTVQKIAHYDEDPVKVTSMRGGMREQLMQWVNQVNPGYLADQFANRAPTRKNFTTGTQGQQINAINTAIGHIDQITNLAAKLGNGSFVPGNEFYNWAKTAFGANAVTNFDTLKDALAGEVASVLSKGGATVSGIADAKGKIKASSSPSQLAGYVKTLIPVMGSKLAAFNYQYHQAMGENDPFSALSPESKSILQKHGFNPDQPEIGATGTGDTMIDVQIPGQGPGKIHASQWDNFLKKYPNAKKVTK